MQSCILNERITCEKDFFFLTNKGEEWASGRVNRFLKKCQKIKPQAPNNATYPVGEFFFKKFFLKFFKVSSLNMAASYIIIIVGTLCCINITRPHGRGGSCTCSTCT